MSVWLAGIIRLTKILHGAPVRETKTNFTHLGIDEVVESFGFVYSVRGQATPSVVHVLFTIGVN